MLNYRYVSKKCRSLVRELSADPSCPFTWMSMVIGFRVCYNLALVLCLRLSKKSGVRINWNMICDRLNVIAANFVSVVDLPFYV